MSVRRYSRARAEAEAIRLAKALVAGSELLLLGASPDSRFPAARDGKVPARWVVLFERPGVEGPVDVGINLTSGEATFIGEGGPA